MKIRSIGSGSEARSAMNGLWEIPVGKWLDTAYFMSAAWMPVWWPWQYRYVESAASYFERKDRP